MDDIFENEVQWAYEYIQRKTTEKESRCTKRIIRRYIEYYYIIYLEQDRYNKFTSLSIIEEYISKDNFNSLLNSLKYYYYYYYI